MKKDTITPAETYKINKQLSKQGYSIRPSSLSIKCDDYHELHFLLNGFTLLYNSCKNDEIAILIFDEIEAKIKDLETMLDSNIPIICKNKEESISTMTTLWFTGKLETHSSCKLDNDGKFIAFITNTIKKKEEIKND